ncbi:hypothetical protein Q5752_002713 [Cryptotrichosporon argae]
MQDSPYLSQDVQAAPLFIDLRPRTRSKSYAEVDETEALKETRKAADKPARRLPKTPPAIQRQLTKDGLLPEHLLVSMLIDLLKRTRDALRLALGGDPSQYSTWATTALIPPDGQRVPMILGAVITANRAIAFDIVNAQDAFFARADVGRAVELVSSS